ncbi:MAG: glucosylceramidase [Balneola sp.]|nr:MAG: glucosylceramidase [Balneola sp.]
MFRLFIFTLCTSLLISCKSTDSDGDSQPQFWVTFSNQEALFQNLEDRVSTVSESSTEPDIVINSSEIFQEMDGFGYTLTGGSAFLLNNMDESSRQQILQELFGQGEGEIGVSYLRVSVGSSDLDASTFSYNDLPQGQTDPDMSEFDLGADRDHLIPVLKEILEIYPELKILGSPWSPPVWMKSNSSTVGGTLLEEYYPAYANYFVKYVQQMEAEGITIDAITIQNEPLNPFNNPSLSMSAEAQTNFIRDHLGSAFSEAGITTKIIIYDHNPDRIDYPLEVLSDAAAKQYIDGTAFHLYAGNISALSTVRDAHPEKNIYFTEQWVQAGASFSGDLAWHTRNLIVGGTRNWSRTVLEWNLASDPNQNPHTEGGCDDCLGALTISGNDVSRNVAYYIIAHASKFVRPGSVRIGSNEVDGLPNVAFKNPEGEIILIVLNDSGSTQQVNASVDSEQYEFSLLAGSVATLVF